MFSLIQTLSKELRFTLWRWHGKWNRKHWGRLKRPERRERRMTFETVNHQMLCFSFTKPFDWISELRNFVKAVTLRHFMTLWCPHIHFGTETQKDFYNTLPTDLNSNLADFSPWPRPRRFRPRPRMSEKTPRPQRVPWSCDSCRLVPPNHA